LQATVAFERGVQIREPIPRGLSTFRALKAQPNNQHFEIYERRQKIGTKPARAVRFVEDIKHLWPWNRVGSDRPFPLRIVRVDLYLHIPVGHLIEQLQKIFIGEDLRATKSAYRLDNLARDSTA
jgi:hypothetical protein